NAGSAGGGPFPSTVVPSARHTISTGANSSQTRAGTARALLLNRLGPPTDNSSNRTKRNATDESEPRRDPQAAANRGRHRGASPHLADPGQCPDPQERGNRLAARHRRRDPDQHGSR